MRQDQIERLNALEEKLADVLIAEADPAKWPGHGVEQDAMEKQTRGDRYWCKKNAVATISLLQRVGTLIGAVRLRGAGTTPPTPSGEQGAEGEQQDDLEDDVKAAEKEAGRLLQELQSNSKKAAFDKRTHGSQTG